MSNFDISGYQPAGYQPGAPAAPATLTVGTLVDYLLVWNVPSEEVINAEKIPVRFTLTRADGTAITLASGDTVTLMVTNPVGDTASAPGLLVSSEGPADSIDLAILYGYTAGSGAYRFDMTIQHDGQTISARQTVVVL